MRQRFVEQQQRRILAQHGGQRDALPLAARERQHVARRETREAQQVERGMSGRAIGSPSQPHPARCGKRFSITISSTLALNASCALCGINARRRASGTGGQSATRTPSSSTWPAAGCRKPASAEISVVLPAPFGPAMHQTSPG